MKKSSICSILWKKKLPNSVTELLQLFLSFSRSEFLDFCSAGNVRTIGHRCERFARCGDYAALKMRFTGGHVASLLEARPHGADWRHTVLQRARCMAQSANIGKDERGRCVSFLDLGGT